MEKKKMAPKKGAHSHHASPAKKRTKIGKDMSLPRGEAAKLRKKPGMGSVGKYKNVAKGSFAGPHGTFPINDKAHARNALARAHFSPNPGKIRAAVHKKFPSIGKAKKKAK
jgi:hypothetical protein